MDVRNCYNGWRPVFFHRQFFFRLHPSCLSTAAVPVPAFPLLPAFGHRTEIQNSRPLWLADRPDFRRLGLAFARLRFTTESAAECAEIFRAYLEGRPAAGDFTRGLYERGVE